VIVRTKPGRIQLITQPDHAHLARRVMERCVPLAARPRRDAILHAVGEHDNGWTEEDAAPCFDPATGQVVDFINAPATVRQRVWSRGVARLADDPWAAALVAQHAIVVYDRFRSATEWSPFFAEMEGLRGTMLDASGLSLEELSSDYVFVRLADLISLSFCTGTHDELRFDRWAVQLSGTRVVVTPDVFGGSELPVEIGMREIPDKRYDSDAALRLAVSEAGSMTLRGMVTGG
jgi:uncharacterized protein DUF3891